MQLCGERIEVQIRFCGVGSRREDPFLPRRRARLLLGAASVVPGETLLPSPTGVGPPAASSIHRQWSPAQAQCILSIRLHTCGVGFRLVRGRHVWLSLEDSHARARLLPLCLKEDIPDP